MVNALQGFKSVGVPNDFGDCREGAVSLRPGRVNDHKFSDQRYDRGIGDEDLMKSLALAGTG